VRCSYRDLSPTLAPGVAKLKHGKISAVLRSSGKFLILGRMPRDFRYSTAELEKEADAFKAKGRLQRAAESILRRYECIRPFFARLPRWELYRSSLEMLRKLPKRSSTPRGFM
jgi:hypothetical protein